MNQTEEKKEKYCMGIIHEVYEEFIQDTVKSVVYATGNQTVISEFENNEDFFVEIAKDAFSDSYLNFREKNIKNKTVEQYTEAAIKLKLQDEFKSTIKLSNLMGETKVGLKEIADETIFQKDEIEDNYDGIILIEDTIPSCVQDPIEFAIQEERKEKLNKLIAGNLLTAAEKTVLAMKYGIGTCGHSEKEICNILKLSKLDVRRNLKNATSKLRAAVLSEEKATQFLAQEVEERNA